MFIRKYWLPLSVFLVTIAGVGLYLLATQPPKEPIKVYKLVEPIEKPTTQAPVGDTSQGGHVHADGTWHEGPHEPVEQPSTADGNPPQLHVEPPSVIAQGNPTSDTMQDPSAESSRREWRKWHDEWSRLAKEHVQTTQEWIDALPQTPEELERFNTDESYKREVQRQLQAAMDKDAKAYVRLQEHKKTRPAIPPTR